MRARAREGERERERERKMERERRARAHRKRETDLAGLAREAAEDGRCRPQVTLLFHAGTVLHLRRRTDADLAEQR